MKLRPLILPAFASLALASIYFLPSAGEVAQSAVSMELPNTFGEWQLRNIPASKIEVDTLAKDTEFSKAECYRVREFEFFPDGSPVPDILNLSIVLSGTDINNSIHRPERCMPAQGHRIMSSTDRTLKSTDGREITVKRLMSFQRISTNEARTEQLELNCLTYYFFVGHDRITNDHLGRTLLDIKDRLLYGRDQRWAYVSAAMWYGDIPWIKERPVTEEEADRKLSEFVSQFATSQIDWDQVTP
ncbi:MAG: EpsI family protein [Luteolibacter sp.]